MNEFKKLNDEEDVLCWLNSIYNALEDNNIDYALELVEMPDYKTTVHNQVINAISFDGAYIDLDEGQVVCKGDPDRYADLDEEENEALELFFERVRKDYCLILLIKG